MKPIQLTVSGLHSFREKQTIDFDSLCDGGIFGIFGPTGSGKSSILDAMTLALYGKVERAMNNTHGILNHAEDQLTVSFSFELENASAKKRYVVERVFKRTDDVRVKTAICRLIEAGEEHVVLADKAVDVNEKVYGLLGLTIDDFTRAVVLPQGKFAEFLSLKGAERRQMLQRLFHLEQYGDQLMKKLKKRVTVTRIARNELEAEKTGLGNASSTAVEEAKKQLNDAEVLLQKRNKEFESVTKEFEDKKALWELQQQKVEFEKEKVNLIKEEDRIEDLQKQLKKADEAETLRPYAEALQELRKEKQEAEVNLEVVKKKYSEIKQQYDQISQDYEKVRKEKAEQEPNLVAKREKLVSLKKVELDLQNDQKLLEELQNKHYLLQKKREESQSLLKKAEQFVEKAVSKQQLLQEEQKTKLVTAKEREQLRAAIEAKQNVFQSKQQYNETTEFLHSKSKTLDNEKHKKQLIEAELIKSQNQLKLEYKRLNNLYFQVAEYEKQYKQYIAFAKQRIEEAVEKEEIEKSKKLAFELVKQLEDGAPCPVCGSCDHPSPIHFDAQEQNTNEVTASQLKQQLEQLQSMSNETQTIQLKAESLSQQLVSDFTFVENIQQEEIHVKELVSNDNDITIIAVYQIFKSEFKAMTQDFLEIKAATERDVKQLRELKQEELKISNFISTASVDVNEWTDKQKQNKQKYEQSKTYYEEHFSSIPIDNLEQYQKEIITKDEEYEQLNERIQKSFAFIEEQQAMVKAQEKSGQQLSEEQIGLKTTIDNRKLLINEKHEKLKEFITDNANTSISTLIEFINTKIKNLTDRENNLYQEMQKITNMLHHVQSDLATNEKTYERATSKTLEAEQKWTTFCEKTSFNTIEETLTSLLTETNRQQMKAEIETYLDKMKQLNTDLNRIMEKLSNKEVTLEAWNIIQQVKSEAKTMVEEAVANKGAATNALQELLDKHERFTAIETAQKELDDMLQKLEKLTTVFKGNSFVEYVAEEQLQQVSRDASERLSLLTRGRYAIEVDSQGGFIMRDDANGGVRRPVSSLSGGETFLTSLALALSLSTQIQLRGEYPLQFFFLDEGFGTLDVELLDTVITALEKLQAQNLSVGIISHVQELRARLQRKLIVEPAEPSGKGSSVYLESL
ncbi:exonuclease SbcC [Metabacillus crassostreae]|uniref:AAA family ATPase n=1 Tax=Metabacillus crassostreae TaxID=929098 RepID=UPI00195D8FAB|nr:SbcC/MukB-like Walker B domain-containing protein [Metabacillus crassostreae]MBM7604146.1 exonuclease SbcC [Metabacillus crassostreae]